MCIRDSLDAEDFRHITDFNQLKVLGHLGSAVNEISRPVLMQIGRYVLESMESNCSMIEKIPPKGVSFSDFICTFAMSCYDLRLF